jgi:hypothetical protein
MLWRGAVWFESSSGGGRDRRGGMSGGDRPVISWVALPQITSLQAETAPPTPPRVVVPTVAPPRIEPVKLELPPRILAAVLPMPLPTPPMGVDEGTYGDPAPGSGPDSSGTGGGPRDTGPGSGGGAGDIFAGDIFGPTPLLVARPPAGAPPDDKRKHDVQFWVRADGRVTKIAVNPPIKNSGYRRRFMEAMSDLVFGPVKTRDGRPIDYVYSIAVYP